MPYLAWIFIHFCPLRSAQKITGLKAWVTWSVTTWTTDSPSSQLAAKFACSSRWSAEPDGEKPPSDTAALPRLTFFMRCGNAKRHYRHSITPPDCTCLYLHKERKANKKKEEKKSPVSLQNHPFTAVPLLLAVDFPKGQIVTPGHIRHIPPHGGALLQLPNGLTVNEGGAYRFFQDGVETKCKVVVLFF